MTEAGKARYGSKKTKYKVKVQSPFEKKRAKLAAKEQRMTEKEEITRRKNQLKERQKNLKNIGKTKDESQEKRDQQRQAEKKKVSDMTDDEIKAVVNRIKLEKEYAEAIKKPEKKSGAEVVADILIKSGQQALAEASKVIMVAYMKKAFGVEDKKDDKKKK